MQLIKLSEDDLKDVSSQLTLQRAESYVGNFYDCSLVNSVLIGKIRGNHGEYIVEVGIAENGKISSHKCGCETAKNEFCKHAAALGLTYIYTPWLFSGKKIERSDIKTVDDLECYASSTTLRELFTELKSAGYSLADIAGLLKMSTVQLSGIIKDDQTGKKHQLTEPIKLACLYLLDKKIEK